MYGFMTEQKAEFVMSAIWEHAVEADEEAEPTVSETSWKMTIDIKEMPEALEACEEFSDEEEDLEPVTAKV